MAVLLVNDHLLFAGKGCSLSLKFFEIVFDYGMNNEPEPIDQSY